MHNLKFIRVATGALAALCLAGCEPEDSSSIETRAIYATYEIHEDGAAVRGRAAFSVGNPFGTPLTLGGGDTLLVNGTALAFEPFLLPHYTGTLAPAAMYVFSFSRPDGEHTSTVQAAMPVDIDGPEAGATVSRSSGFTVTWRDPDATGDYVVGVVLAGSSCSGTFAVSVAGATGYTFTASDFTSPGGEGGEAETFCPGQTLNGTLFVESILYGDLAPGHSGSITSRVRTSVPVTVMP